MILKSLFLGLIQGLTEFLPVSSSGHLVVFSSLIDFELAGSDAVFFDVMLHIGTLLAVLVYLRKEIWSMLKNPFEKKTWLLLVATIPAGIIGILFSDFIEGMFDISCVYVGFYFTAFILLFASGFAKTANKDEVSFKSSAVMGVMQSMALLPGVSRSGSTLLGGVFCGVKKTEVAKFSFLMSVPIIIASGFLKVLEFSGEGISSQLAVCSVFGGISAFVFGVIGIKFFLKILEKAKLHYFSYYLFALGTVLLFVTA